ncbi:hypothetical protein RRF57_011831 [Xylaria bambusicola]|uniref:Uncharacterized protein n=1 Tax=Xylaria bambusicola TaxID=326684 RepID=A0AAN7V352_9PEZI
MAKTVQFSDWAHRFDIEEALQVHLQTVCNRTTSLFGTQTDLYTRGKPRERQKHYIDLLHEERPSRRSLALISTVDKVVRETKMTRIWFLDFQIMRDMGRAINAATKLNCGIQLAQKQMLNTQLHRIIREMTSFNGRRQRDELAGQRQKLFALLETLQILEVKAEWGDTESAGERPRRKWDISKGEDPVPFPSSTLRTLETNLLVAEALSTELITRVVLLHTPQLERDVIRKLRNIGYKPNFEPLPRKVDLNIWQPVRNIYPIRGLASPTVIPHQARVGSSFMSFRFVCRY